MASLKLIILSLLLVLSLSMYDGQTSVVKLTTKDFKKVYQGIWLVQFYAPWCGHCKNLAPEYEKAANALKGIANIAAIDASNEKIDIQIQGYPTIKLFVDGKPSDYNGQRNAEGIIEFMLREFKKIANKRIGGGSSHSDSGSHSGHGGSADEKDVIVLTDQNFEQLVYGDQSAWFIEFYAPWCGHCKTLAPQWAALATNLKGQVKVAKVDATESKQLASRFGVRGYPTIKFFRPGQKDDSSAVDYQGARSESAMAEWAREQTQQLKIFEQVQLTSQALYDETCKGRNLCVISFLPDLLDSTQQQRDAYLNTIKQVGLKFKGKPFKFLWSQGADQFEFEEKVGISGIGYPSVVVIYEAKQVFGKLQRSFSEQNLQNFLSQIMKNKAKFSKLVPLPTLKTVQAAAPSASQSAETTYGSEEGCNQHKCTGPSDAEQQNTEQFGEQL